jgi:ribosomal protein S18 acetylase RimI-like enzyme
MTLRELRPVGLAYLEQVTRLLQDARRAEPSGGVWEAADLQWWWRVDQHSDPGGQTIWVDDDGPEVAAVFTRWKGWIGCDLLGTDASVKAHRKLLWEHIDRRFRDSPVSMIIRDDDPTRIVAAERAGFVRGDDEFATAWMDAADRPGRPTLPKGIGIRPYEGGPHPMVARNGEKVAERLAETSLYRPDLDLAVWDGDSVAGYALFWADPITGVGLLEPMRIEAAYQGRGLAKALIAEGLDRLAAAGCARLKVSFEPTNEAAARLYLGAGFRPQSFGRTWRRVPSDLEVTMAESSLRSVST